ncbi:thioredoxin-1, putative [Entamoeba invadens IP1]|uniref:Thioredoxin n=1 Tax=Entamoeba invadens IP1 TaxID=370355 RepID=L7FLQ7_ENTIV|nr:thioredoxin-1, putative [Entamoeba invadens IP1]ELP88763.1 thioredoxin-1, putative [Entamoeba invadens IP1]|eukprot:XP_004255534.1 thioredoxin-1, putative [Entamoeba invadens IP1]
MNMTTPFLNTNTELDMIKTRKTVLVYFTATWCRPCTLICSLFEKLSSQNKQKEFVKVDADEGYEICKRYGVRAVPTFILFREKKEVCRLFGNDQKVLTEMASSM